MILSSSIFSAALLALTVSANPIVIRDNLIRLPITKRYNLTTGNNILKGYQACAATLRAHGGAKAAGNLAKDAVISTGIENQEVSYVADVGVGSPATTYSLLVDTGSSNTWVGAGKAYVKTSTSIQTSEKVEVSYGSGAFSGTEFTDTVTLADGLVIKTQSIGVARKSEGVSGMDGVLGLGPVDLTKGTLSPAAKSTIPTVTDNAFSQGIISADEVSISFEPTDSDTVTNGELTFGGIDSSKFTGSITFAPITVTSPASEFWGIKESITYGSSTTILSMTAGVVDTGTSLMLIASDALERYKAATGAIEDRETGLLRLTEAKFSKLQSLFFNINGRTFEFTANAQAWPRSLNTAIGGDKGNVYLTVADIGTHTGEGLDFINGFAWMERFYTVFDTANKRVGFATTPFTNATTS